MIFEYKGNIYPDYLKDGGASRFISATAKHFCKGNGIDVGCGAWPLDGAQGYDLNLLAHDTSKWSEACDIKVADNSQDYVFSSHCLEHLENPIKALKHWISKIKEGGVLFLYLPHPDMEYWLPQNCSKHLHSWMPNQMAKILNDLGMVGVLYSERDLIWSFSVVGFKPALPSIYL